MVPDPVADQTKALLAHLPPEAHYLAYQLRAMAWELRDQLALSHAQARDLQRQLDAARREVAQ